MCASDLEFNNFIPADPFKTPAHIAPVWYFTPFYSMLRAITSEMMYALIACVVLAAGFGKVFEIGDVFRADPSFTSRHATEFTSIDAEISWIDSHEDVMAMHEQLLTKAIAAVVERHGADHGKGRGRHRLAGTHLSAGRARWRRAGPRRPHRGGGGHQPHGRPDARRCDL